MVIDEMVEAFLLERGAAVVRLRRLIWCNVIAVVAGCGTLPPTPEPAGPAPQPGEMVVAWTEDLLPLSPGVELFFRNVSNHPVQITTITLYDCDNVKGGCGTESVRIVLSPGQARGGRTIEPENPRRSFHYKYRYVWSPMLRSVAAPSAT